MKRIFSKLEVIKTETILNFFHDYKLVYLLSLVGSKNNYCPCPCPPRKLGQKESQMHFFQTFKEQIM